MPIQVNSQGVAKPHSGNFNEQLSASDNKQLLLEFSRGCQDSDFIKATLGLESEEDLVLLMAKAGLPMPVLPEHLTLAMVVELHQLPSHCIHC